MLLREKISRRAAKAGLSPSVPLVEGLTSYFELLRKWNRKVSLTALPVEDAGDEAIDRLLVEPLLAIRHLPRPDAVVIDMGSGGGSPAVPLKLAASGISLRMVEAKTRKAAFLREVVRTLELTRTEVEAVRFEELLARPAMHEGADVVTVRAVKLDAKMLARLQFFLKPGGLLLLFGTGSGAVPDSASPQLIPQGTHVLLKHWGSQLQVLRKS